MVDTFTEGLRVACVALAAGFVLLVAECIRHWRWQRRQAQPFDWEESCPELRERPRHVKVVHVPPRWQ